MKALVTIVLLVVLSVIVAAVASASTVFIPGLIGYLAAGVLGLTQAEVWAIIVKAWMILTGVYWLIVLLYVMFVGGVAWLTFD